MATQQVKLIMPEGEAALTAKLYDDNGTEVAFAAAIPGTVDNCLLTATFVDVPAGVYHVVLFDGSLRIAIGAVELDAVSGIYPEEGLRRQAEKFQADEASQSVSTLLSRVTESVSSLWQDLRSMILGDGATAAFSSEALQNLPNSPGDVTENAPVPPDPGTDPPPDPPLTVTQTVITVTPVTGEALTLKLYPEWDGDSPAVAEATATVDSPAPGMASASFTNVPAGRYRTMLYDASANSLAAGMVTLEFSTATYPVEALRQMARWETAESVRTGLLTLLSRITESVASLWNTLRSMIVGSGEDAAFSAEALQYAQAGSTQAGAESITTLNATPTKQTFLDGCPVLPKMQCHEIQQGQDARLLWTFRDREGQPVDLTPYIAAVSPGGDPYDALGSPDGIVGLRLREITGKDTSDPVYQVPVEILDPSTGQLRAQELPEKLVRAPGVYMEEWGLFSPNKKLLFSNQCCTFIRRGIFGLSSPNAGPAGPPSIEEIRLSLRDSSAADNPLLDDVEFDAAEIAQAVVRPLNYWNEVPPPLHTVFTTKTFPFQEIWALGIQAYLLEIAAHHYRRNHLPYSAAGVSLDDKNKETPYERKAMELMQRFQEMVRMKKIEVNLSGFYNEITSEYY